MSAYMTGAGGTYRHILQTCVIGSELQGFVEVEDGDLALEVQEMELTENIEGRARPGLNRGRRPPRHAKENCASLLSTAGAEAHIDRMQPIRMDDRDGCEALVAGSRCEALAAVLMRWSDKVSKRAK